MTLTKSRGPGGTRASQTETTRLDQLIQGIQQRTSRVAVIGLGYVGLPIAVEAARAGFSVIGIEEKLERANWVNQGVSYIPDVPTPRLREQVESGQLHAYRGFQEISRADVVVICVPTPLGKNKDPDIQYVERVTRESAPYLRKGQLLILESTTYPGTTEEVILPQVRASGFRVGEEIFVAYSPERIDPGNRSFDLHNTPKVVGGVTAACSMAAKAFYAAALHTKVHVVSSPATAEMVKLLENVFRVVNVSLVNELAQLCDRMGLDVWEVIEAAKTKPFGFMPFYPGPGMGGHCIPVDPFYLSWKAKEYDFAMRFIELAGEINDAQPLYVVQHAMEILNERGHALRGARVLLLGVAYKRDTSDTRESPALKVAHLLRERGALLGYHDPYVPEIMIDGETFRSTELTREVLHRNDLVIVTTDHSTVDYRLVASAARAVYDTRNAFHGTRSKKVRRLGAPRTPGVAAL